MDANLLVYAHVSTFPQHERARGWLEEQLSGTARIGLPWASLLAFVRLVSNPRVFSEPEPITEAWAQVEAWLDAEPAWTPEPTRGHRTTVGRCLAVPGLGANDVPDAELAALALEHGLELASTNSGFARFEELRWFDPISA